VETEPTSTFDLDQVLNPLIDRATGDNSANPIAIECVVRWNPAKRCLPELVIDQDRAARLAARKSRFDLRLIRRDDPHGSEPRAIPPSIGVEFTVQGASFDPRQLTSAIGIEPDATSRSDPIHPKRLDTWTRGGNRVRETEFQPLLDDLLNELTPKAAQIRTFCVAHGATATFAFVAEVVNQAPHLLIGAGQFIQVAALSASIWFDPYCREQLSG